MTVQLFSTSTSDMVCRKFFFLYKMKKSNCVKHPESEWKSYLNQLPLPAMNGLLCLIIFVLIWLVWSFRNLFGQFCGKGTFARMDFCQNSGKCPFWDFCQNSSSGKCPSLYIKFWQMSHLINQVLANVPPDISSSGKCPS